MPQRLSISTSEVFFFSCRVSHASPSLSPPKHDHWKLYLPKGINDRKLKEGSCSVYSAGTKALMQSSQCGISGFCPLVGEDLGGVVSGISHS